MPLNALTPVPSTIFFVDPNYVKQTTSLNKNVDDKMVMEAIQSAQDMFILPILGSTLMEDMLQHISGGTLDTLHAYLINSFVRPCLVAATMMHLLPFIHFQFQNKGVEKQHSDYSESATVAEVSWLIEKYREKGAFYAQRLTQYLTDNTQYFQNWLNPQLGNTSSGADLFYPQNSAYSCGLYLNNLPSNSPGREYTGYGLSMSQYIEWRGEGI